MYLKNLYELYCQTVKLCTELQTFNLGNDSQFLSKLTKSIFQRHLNSYIRLVYASRFLLCCVVSFNYFIPSYPSLLFS